MGTATRSITVGAIFALLIVAAKPAEAQTEPFLGQLMLFSGTYCPKGWADANGQLLSISQNQALFALLGTTYGGDGSTTFALPDLRGSAPIHTGQGPGLSNYQLGQSGGAESFTIGIRNMPRHSHQVNARNGGANRSRPGGRLLAGSKDGPKVFTDGQPNVIMDAQMIGSTGRGRPITHRGPYLTMRWCIALQGVFPSPP